jgi:NADH:ubiquinone oxidoreductase subunit 3 (chain A)
LVFPLIPLALAWLWRRFFQPPKPGAEKNATYECGVESIGDAQIQFRSQYYLYAIIFLIFDVEAIFLVPFAVAFTGLPVGAFIAILIFLLLADRRSYLGLGQRVLKLGALARWLKLLKALHCYNRR